MAIELIKPIERVEILDSKCCVMSDGTHRVYAGAVHAKLPGNPWDDVVNVVTRTYNSLTGGFTLRCDKEWITLTPLNLPNVSTATTIKAVENDPTETRFGLILYRDGLPDDLAFRITHSLGVHKDGNAWWFDNLEGGKLGGYHAGGPLESGQSTCGSRRNVGLQV